MNKSSDDVISSISGTLKQVKDLVDVNTIVGEQITLNNGTTIIPISKVVVGYMGGGGEYFDIKVKKNEYPFASGCGTGAYIKPIGFLTIDKNGNTNFIEIDKSINLNDIMHYFSNVIDSLKGDKND